MASSFIALRLLKISYEFENLRQFEQSLATKAVTRNRKGPGTQFVADRFGADGQHLSRFLHAEKPLLASLALVLFVCRFTHARPKKEKRRATAVMLILPSS